MKNQAGDRIRNSARNIATSALLQTVLGVLAFIDRKIFITYLSAEFLGLNTLFYNVLNVMSMAELGIASAIAFSLYKPLAEGNMDLVGRYMKFFQKAYFVIGSIILVVGVTISPFIEHFVSSDVDLGNVQELFLIYLFAVGLTYFFSYKQILIEADQKKYINQLGICLGSILMVIFQMVSVSITKSFTVYICLYFVFTVGKNFSLSIVANRLYPVLRKKAIEPLGKKEKKSLTRSIKAMSMHKFGEVAIDSIDSILISALVDIRTLGLYANYQIILNSLNSAMRVFYTSILASIGNLYVTEDDETVYQSFKALDFVNFTLFSFVAVFLFNVSRPFISIWLGSRYVLPESTLIMITLVFFITGSRKMLLNFHDAAGLFWSDRWKRIAEAVINLITSIILGKKYGINGIFAGTLICNTFGFIVESVVVHKYAFYKGVGRYYVSYLLRLLFISLCFSISFFTTAAVEKGMIFNLLWAFITSTLIYIILFAVFYRRNDNFYIVKSKFYEIIHMLGKKNEK